MKDRLLSAIPALICLLSAFEIVNIGERDKWWFVYGGGKEYAMNLIMAVVFFIIVSMVLIIISIGQLNQHIKIHEFGIDGRYKSSVASTRRITLNYSQIIGAYCEGNDLILHMTSGNYVRFTKMRDAEVTADMINYNIQNMNYPNMFGYQYPNNNMPPFPIPPYPDPPGTYYPNNYNMPPQSYPNNGYGEESENLNQNQNL